jgi:outer membrane lipoprotein carrier protein
MQGTGIRAQGSGKTGLALIFGVALLCGSATSAQAPSDAILHVVDEHYNQLASLRTRYVEHYAGMGMTRTESGTLLLKKPGRMRWMYDQPAGKVFVLDGKFAWFYTPGDAQAQRIPAKQMDDLRTPLRFLLGHTELKKELDGISVAPDSGGFHITGVPKGMQNRIKELSLRVTASGSITAMRLEELDGAVTEFTFSDGQENVPVKDSDFVFVAPPGVTIINGPTPM